jgi:putative two-component system response regulator
VVVLDDAAANVALLEELLARWGYANVVGVTSASDAIELCRREPPDLLLLDMHMPEQDGLAVLRALEDQVRGPSALPVLVLTGQSGPSHKHEALEAGARDFVLKPFDHDEVRIRVRNALELRRMQLEHVEVERSLEEHAREARREVAERLARAGEFRDDDTGEHARRVGRTTALLAQRIRCDPDLVDDLALAAPLHDIGKLALPDAILLKRGRLNQLEKTAMQSHTVIGAQLLAGSSSRLLTLAAEVALSHHERWDGGGYPSSLAGEEIPLSGRLVALADVFDALTHERPYKPAWTVEESVAEMASQRGGQFDPEILDVFLGLDHDALT